MSDKLYMLEIATYYFSARWTFEKLLFLIITGGFIYFIFLKETLGTLFCFIIKEIKISFSLTSLPILYNALRKGHNMSMLVKK